MKGRGGDLPDFECRQYLLMHDEVSISVIRHCVSISYSLRLEKLHMIMSNVIDPQSFTTYRILFPSRA